MRVSARLVDAQTGANLWVDQFDDRHTDLLDMQEDIVTRIARTIRIELTALEAARLFDRPNFTASSSDILPDTTFRWTNSSALADAAVSNS